MSDPSKHSVFSAADIERYHNGSMKPEERHALEKAALDDPFLADALEGYTYTTTPQQDLTKLQKRLKEKITTKKTFPLFTNRSSLLKAAAILLLVAGGGWLVYTTMRPPRTGVANTSVGIITSKSPVEAVDTTRAITDHNTNSVRADTIGSVPAVANASESLFRQPRITKPHKSKPVKAIADALNQNKKREEQALANIKLASTRAEAVTSATPPTSYPATAKQSFVAAASDSTALASKDQSSSDTLKLNIVLKEDKANLSEVVVVNKGLKRKAEVKPSVTVEEPEPADGWNSFSDYIAERLKEPKLKEKYSGEVELSFEVDQKGEPVNIVVTKSLCNQCDEEAIRLLKEGPKWKKKAHKGKVTIHF